MKSCNRCKSFKPRVTRVYLFSHIENLVENNIKGEPVSELWCRRYCVYRVNLYYSEHSPSAFLGAVFLANVPEPLNCPSVAVKVIYNSFQEPSVDLQEKGHKEFSLVQACGDYSRFFVNMFSLFVDKVKPSEMPGWDADDNVSHSSIFIVMEAFPYNLKQFLHNNAISERKALLILYQLCLAVEFLQKFEIAHRDIKLDNILVDDKLRVVLADFGSAM